MVSRMVFGSVWLELVVVQSTSSSGNYSAFGLQNLFLQTKENAKEIGDIDLILV
ncbi:unnamed protein product [marine sediment metagenome]|uniref:Uncharacterized protein n=1 Tax=marine sediment metagenome TaxID=412755 RepID=X1AZU9_9ZZZZ